MKRYLYLWHRWLGIGLCLVMALWFVSGVVMLYVGYPKLTPAERTSHLPPLPITCCVSLPDELAEQPVLNLRLTSLGGRPFYRLERSDGTRIWLDATSGQLLGNVDQNWILASAKQFSPDTALHYSGQVNEDVWTHSRRLDRERPLHRVDIADAAQTRLYLSGRSGEVVLDASAQERQWGWVGAWLHWVYPLRGGFGLSDGWRGLVIGLSLFGTLMAVLGMVVGILRWRRRPYRSGSHSPYPQGWMRWHHLSGLLFGVMLVAWVFSGLMSMQPWGLTDNQSELDPMALRGGALRPADFDLDVHTTLRRLEEQGFTAVELDWQRLAGENYLVAWNASSESRILPNEHDSIQSLLPLDSLLRAAKAMAAGNAMQHDWLEGYDSYYFERASQSMYGIQRRPLPVLRVRFDDPAQSWIYLDPHSGELVARQDRSQRTGRWLFNLLHSWDVQPLLKRPLLREALIIAFSVGGLVMSISGIVLGWRRLHHGKRSQHRARQGSTQGVEQ